MSNSGSFYNVHSPDMVMSVIQVANLEKFQLSPNFALNNRKFIKFLVEKYSDSDVISQPSRRGGNTPPPLPLGLLA